MRVLADSCVWSAVLRRGSGMTDPVRLEMQRLIESGAVEIIGPIRQEVLSGVRSDTQFDSLKEALGLFPEIPILSEDYDTAARFYNLCRRRGIQGSGTDFLICAVTAREDIPIFTVDQDFERYAEILPVALHRSSARS